MLSIKSKTILRLHIGFTIKPILIYLSFLAIITSFSLKLNILYLVLNIMSYIFTMVYVFVTISYNYDKYNIFNKMLRLPVSRYLNSICSIVVFLFLSFVVFLPTFYLVSIRLLVPYKIELLILSLIVITLSSFIVLLMSAFQFKFNRIKGRSLLLIYSVILMVLMFSEQSFNTSFLDDAIAFISLMGSQIISIIMLMFTGVIWVLYALLSRYNI